MKEHVSLGHVGHVKLHYVTALRAILDQFPLQPRQIRKKKSWRPKTNPVYYEKGVACVAEVKRERGRVMWAPPTHAPKPLLPLPLLTPVTQAIYTTSKSNGHYHKGLQLT